MMKSEQARARFSDVARPVVGDQVLEGVASETEGALAELSLVVPAMVNEQRRDVSGGARAAKQVDGQGTEASIEVRAQCPALA
jgi:hypothetical protein